jgi:ATP-dependent DNA helicase RecG
MMQQLNDDEIIQIINGALSSNTENDRVEFKDARGGIPDNLWEPITGFSNKHSGGGIIVFGVEENRRTRHFSVVHSSNIHDLMERATNYINDRIVNADRPQYRTLNVQGEDLLVIVLNTVQDEKKPCFDRRKGMDRGACIREGNTNRPITDDELRNFIRNSSAFKYDISPAESYTLEELDNDKVQQVLTEMGLRTGRQNADNSITDTLLENIKIAVNDNGNIKPSLAGVLVFFRGNPLERNPFNRYIIRCVRYAGSTPSSPILDKQDIGGTLDSQIDDMQRFILRNIPRRAAIEGALRVESYEYPEEAIREVIANAVVHRDYTITESYTQVRIFSDRIEFVNPGNLPPGVTVDNIKEMQFSRNSVIASLMRDLNYLEEYGRGIDLVFSSMQQLNLPRPIFRNAANMFSVTLLSSQFSGLSERQLAIWQFILNKSRTSAKEVSEALKVTRPTVVSDLNKLISLGMVAAIGSGPSTAYEIGTNV